MIRLRMRGFTLIELTLAMAFIVVLSMSLYTSLRVALRARNSATTATESTRAASIVTGVVRQDFESVTPPGSIYAGPFIGVVDDVQFCTIGRDDRNDDSPLAEGIRRVELLVRADVNPPTLVRRVTRNLQPALTAEYDEEIIARDVHGLALHYFDGTTWQESWDSTAVGSLPMAVSISFEMADPAHPQSPPRRVSSMIPLACGKPADAASTMGGL
jgi:prepilin-type N-terminal cleavage/methylation domain-containing protein